jgi:Na+-driven multidrug efflux pump
MSNKHLLEGSVTKSLLKIALPVIIANILQSVYQLIDTFWVGRLGAKAVASVSLSFPIMFFLTSFAMGITMAGSILIAQYNGKGNKEKVSLATGQTSSIAFNSSSTTVLKALNLSSTVTIKKPIIIA